MTQDNAKNYRLMDLLKEQKQVCSKNIKSVEDIMTKEVVTLTTENTIEEALQIFIQRRFRHLPILGASNTLAGIVSDRDILRHISPLVGTSVERDIDIATLKKRLESIMSRRLITATPKTTLHEATRLMIEKKINCLPVIDSRQKIKGIVTSFDLLRALETITFCLTADNDSR